MKKILSYIMILIVIVTLYGCNDPNYKTPEEIGQMRNETIMEALKARDKEKLKQVLAKSMQNQENIYEEIDNLINFIDGNIVTDTGKKYDLKFYNYYVNRNHEDYVGVIQVSIYDTEIYTEENDYPDNGSYGIYLDEEGDEE